MHETLLHPIFSELRMLQYQSFDSSDNMLAARASPRRPSQLDIYFQHYKRSTAEGGVNALAML